jgi:hypothetical protein
VIDVKNMYINFVVERHHVWVQRSRQFPPPWTNDHILLERKFTNVFRILDYGSQFLVKELLYDEDATPSDVLFRAILYRYTNRPEPWVYFRERHGHYPEVTDLKRGKLQATWQAYNAQGGPIFGTAYRMFVGQENKGSTRLGWAIDTAKEVFDGRKTFSRHFYNADSLEDRIQVLREEVPRCAAFMSMQIATDMGYSPYPIGTEDDYVVPGPGCQAGAAVLGMNGLDAIEWAKDQIGTAIAIALPNGNRNPSRMDIQNTLCEFSKYHRYNLLPPTGRPYRPVHPVLPEPFYPPHWTD